MLVKLKHQQLRPTLLLTILYLVLSHVIALFSWFLFQVFSPISYKAYLTDSASYVYSIFSLLLIVSTIANFCALHKIHQSYFKKHPVTPLFIFTIGAIAHGFVFFYIALLSVYID